MTVCHPVRVSAGLYLVLSVLPPTFADPASRAYCHRALYLTSAGALLVTLLTVLLCAAVAALWLWRDWEPPAAGLGLWPAVSDLVTPPCADAGGICAGRGQTGGKQSQPRAC